MTHVTMCLLTLAAVLMVAPAASAQSGESASIGVSAAATAADTTMPDDHYGQAPTIDPSHATGVGAALADTTVHGRTVLLRGRVEDICQKKGCWMVVTDGERSMRVTFKDYGFFVPMDAIGDEVLIEGVVAREEISEEVARHYAEESKTENPEEIHGPQQVVTMVATGVRFHSPQ